jgi:hypothetical protein
MKAFQSKATSINAENYAQVKQEAYANQAHNTNFGPFQPKKSIDTPAQDPTTVTKKHGPKGLPLDKRFMSRTIKTSINTPAQDEPSKSKEQDEPSKSKDVVEETCKGNEDPKEQDEPSKEMEIKLPGRRKQVWKPGGNVHWKENIDVDPDEVVQVEGIHT